jgi:transcriptional regulator with XRE-family HTH domain
MLPDITHQTSIRFPYRDGMKSADQKLREVVALNLGRLMERREWSQTELARKTGVSQRHISNMLNSQTGASFETLSAVGRAFGIPGWMLLLDDVPVELLDSQKIPLLVASFRDAGPDGRDLIEKLAAREAVHNREQTKVTPLRKSAG